MLGDNPWAGKAELPGPVNAAMRAANAWLETERHGEKPA